MNTKARSLPILLFLLLFTIWYSNACTCRRQTREQAYNSSHYVSHLLILNRTMEATDVSSSTSNKTHKAGHVIYEVEHLRVFKPVGATLSTRIFTSPDSNTCGRSGLRPGQEYLLAGENFDFKNRTELYLSLCDKVEVVQNGTLLNGGFKLEDDPILQVLIKG